MDYGIAGKTAIVTGSTAGIGFAIATALAREGAHVVLNGRTQARIDEASEELLRAVPGATVQGVPADLSTAAGCAAFVAAAPKADILVNNMGIFEPKVFEDIPDEDWQRMFEVNVMSGIRLARHYLGGMKAAAWGRILFISSESGVQIPEEMVHYGMTKTAQIAVARGLAETCKQTGITVNSLLVGPTQSEGVAVFVEELAKQSGMTTAEMETDFFANARPTSLLQRFIEVDEVANMAAYLCSQAASATTGSPVRVDGGVIRSAL
jgi:NAD(P)-dependent dehydrogenase (short-subunit alcohol dehydrogenase family)